MPHSDWAVVFWVMRRFAMGTISPLEHLAGGLLFASVWERTRSLTTCFVVHAGVNLVVGLADVALLLASAGR